MREIMEGPGMPVGATVDLRLAPVDDPIWIWRDETGAASLLDADKRPLTPVVAAIVITGATVSARYDYMFEGSEEDDDRTRHSFLVKSPVSGRDSEKVVLSMAHVRSIRVHTAPVHECVGEFDVVLHDDGTARVNASCRDARWSRAEVRKVVRLLAAHAGLEVVSPASPRAKQSAKPRRPAKRGA